MLFLFAMGIKTALPNLENELCTVLISSEFDSASPFMLESNEETNSLNDESVGPSDISFCSALSSTDRMAWVAQALLITCKEIARMLTRRMLCWKLTCLAKNILSALESLTTVPAGFSSGTHLKRKTRPWTGFRLENWSLSRDQSSSTCTPLTPERTTCLQTRLKCKNKLMFAPNF